MAVRKRKTTRKKKAAPKRKARPLSAATQKTLRAKAKRTKYTYGQLARVYRRGQGAFLSSGSRAGVGMAGWAMGRVNSFIRGGHSQDNDIKRGAKKRKTRKKK
jgi:hypothetical protein|tara:strand:+ start:33 stop:341 length:309 start_codon:yes stop_codon:yes gene_type:complete